MSIKDMDRRWDATCSLLNVAPLMLRAVQIHKYCSDMPSMKRTWSDCSGNLIYRNEPFKGQ